MSFAESHTLNQVSVLCSMLCRIVQTLSSEGLVGKWHHFAHYTIGHVTYVTDRNINDEGDNSLRMAL